MTPTGPRRVPTRDLRAGKMEGGELIARSRVIRRGRKVAVCAADVHQDGEVIATGLFTYLILKRKS